MKVYETTFILSPQADDATFDRQIKSVTELINRNKGKLLHEDRWGIRRMAYPILKFNQGYYTRLVFEATNDVLTEMERFFRLEEPYIRHLTVLFEGDLNAPKADPFAKPEADAKPRYDRNAPAADKKPTEVAPPVEAPAPAAEKVEPPKAEEASDDAKPTE